MQQSPIFRLKTIALAALFSSLLSLPAMAEEDVHNDADHAHAAEIELGLSLGYAYLKEEDKHGTSIHLHINKGLADEGLMSRVSIGLGVETIITDEQHYAAMVSVNIQPWDNLILSYAPGIEWAKHHTSWASEYANHFEATYIIENKDFHFGPVIGYSSTRDAQHFTAGIHFAMPL